MSINAEITLKRLVYEISTWATAHSMIQAFGYGKYLETFASDEARKYPVFVVNCPNYTQDQWYFNYNLELICLEWVFDDRGNRVPAASDTAKIISDFENTIRESNRWQSFSRIDGNFNGRKVDEFGGDKADGWITTFILKVKKTSGICNLQDLLPTYDFENIPSPLQCQPVLINVNGENMTSAVSGSTVDITIVDALGVPQGVRTPEDSFNYEVPAGITLERIYLRPQPTGQLLSSNDYDDAWKVLNNSDTYVPPESGIPMIIDPENVWKVLPDNLWGHKWRICGSTGGYYDNILDGYYDVDGNSTTYELAYPNDKMWDHSTGLQWVNTVLTKKTVSSETDNIYVQMNAYTNDGESGYFVGNANENESIRDMGVQWAFYDQPPFDQIGGANKWSSTTAAYSSSTGYSNRITGELTGTSKGTSQFTIPMKYALP